jgi:predicted DNA-binding ribbon-helix-helix protein
VAITPVNDFFERYVSADLATPNHQKMSAKIFAETTLKSLVAKRSVIIGGQKTSVSLEDPFWNDLKEIAYFQRATLSQVVEEIDRARQHNNLSSAIRLFVLDQVRMHGDPWRYSRVRHPAKRRISALGDEADV